MTNRFADWKKFYQDLFGLEKDFSKLVVPEHIFGFDRLLVIAEMTPNLLFAKCAELFPSCAWQYISDFNTVVSVRKADRDYAIWVRDRVEADEENANKSAEEVLALEREGGVSSITLEERLVYELKYFSETEKHLDTRNWTLCSGSCSSVGYVPFARWYDGEFYVCWYSPRSAYGNLRSRSEVSQFVIAMIL